MSMVVGLTGGIGMGKSTVAAMFEDAGIPVIDTDKITYQLEAKGQKCYMEIVKNFGREILKETGEIDRGKLAAIVFKDPVKKAILEKILHPRVKATAVETLLDLDDSIIIIDVPLLFESHFDDIVEKVIVVFTSEEVQIERICGRNKKMTPELAKLRINAQMKISEKIKRADYLIENSGSLEDLQRKFDDLLEKLDKEADKREQIR